MRKLGTMAVVLALVTVGGVMGNSPGVWARGDTHDPGQDRGETRLVTDSHDAPMTLPALQVGDCIESEEQEETCLQLGGEIAVDTGCPEYPQYYLDGCIGEFPYYSEGQCTGDGGIVMSEPNCDYIGGLGCFLSHNVRQRCIGVSPVGGVAELPPLDGMTLESSGTSGTGSMGGATYAVLAGAAAGVLAFAVLATLAVKRRGVR